MPAPKQPRPHGNQTRYTAALGERICEHIAEGASTRKAAKAEGVSETAVRKWAKDERLAATFGSQYVRACELRTACLESALHEDIEAADALAEQAKTLGDTSTRLQAIKLSSDLKKWVLSKLLREKYGDKQAVELTGKEGAPLIPAPSDDALRRLAVMQAEAAAELAERRRET